MREFFKKLIEEIHHRSLWQVTLVYVGGGWAMLGHVDLLKEFGAPEGVFEAAAIILVVGYVVVLGIAAWPRVMRRVAPPKERMLEFRSDPDLAQALADRGYTIERVLGHGGMATVFLAEDTRHQRPVAPPRDTEAEEKRGDDERVPLSPSGATPEEIRPIVRALRAGEISREDSAKLLGEEGEPEVALRPKALAGGFGGPAKLFVLAVGLMLVLWVGLPSGGGSPIPPLFLVALWPITVILGYSLFRRRTAI